MDANEPNPAASCAGIAASANATTHKLTLFAEKTESQRK
jgi:hypothetical protein